MSLAYCGPSLCAAVGIRVASIATHWRYEAATVNMLLQQRVTARCHQCPLSTTAFVIMPDDQPRGRCDWESLVPLAAEHVGENFF